MWPLKSGNALPLAVMLYLSHHLKYLSSIRVLRKVSNNVLHLRRIFFCLVVVSIFFVVHAGKLLLDQDDRWDTGVVYPNK